MLTHCMLGRNNVYLYSPGVQMARRYGLGSSSSRLSICKSNKEMIKHLALGQNAEIIEIRFKKKKNQHLLAEDAYLEVGT